MKQTLNANTASEEGLTACGGSYDQEHHGIVDQGYTGEQAAQDAAAEGIHLEVVKLPEAGKGFVLVPRRWVVERSFAWTGRFRRLARDYERVARTVVGFHLVAFTILMLRQFTDLAAQSA